MIVLFVIYFAILWFLWAWYNCRIIKQKDFHTAGAFVAVFVVLGIVLSPKFGILIYCWQDVAYLSFIALTLRWCFFDIFLNLMLKQKWYYIGATSWLDRNLMHWQFIIKIIFLFLSISMCLSYGGIGVY